MEPTLARLILGRQFKVRHNLQGQGNKVTLVTLPTIAFV
jgi:hypothetical protein